MIQRLHANSVTKDLILLIVAITADIADGSCVPVAVKCTYLHSVNINNIDYLCRKSSVPKLGFASEVRVCAKCLPDASKGGIKKASGKQHMQEFYKLHPPPKATKAPPPPTKEETIAGVLKQVEAAEADCKTQNWAAVISRKTPLYTYIETNRQHLDNAFIDDAKARFTVCETEANRALFDEQVRSFLFYSSLVSHVESGQITYWSTGEIGPTSRD